jgi:hypothetical protein
MRKTMLKVAWNLIVATMIDGALFLGFWSYTIACGHPLF